MTDKQTLRKTLLEKRKAYHLTHGASAGAQLLAQFQAQPVLRPGTWRIGAYMPAGSEIDPLPLLQHLQDLGHRLCLPFCERSDQPASFRAYQMGDALAADDLGISAPLRDVTCRPDIVLLPLLAADRLGHRLGRGGGTYDRTLAALRDGGKLQAIGLAYDMQLVDNCPVELHDQSLDGVLTTARYLPAHQPK
jgi:5-formyltetrahydrofolate cyclo-ligase